MSQKTNLYFYEFIENILKNDKDNIIYLSFLKWLKKDNSTIDLLNILIQALKSLNRYDDCAILIDKYLSMSSYNSKDFFLECLKYAYCSENISLISKYTKKIKDEFSNNIEKPPFNEKQVLLDQQLDTYVNRPLLIVFQGFVSKIVEEHYKKYQLSNLKYLNNTLPHGGMSLFINNDTFNLIHVKDELQVYYLLHRKKFISLLKYYIKILNPSHVITFGSSAGGTAALAFGEFLQADMSLAFSPQTICFDLYVNKYRKEMNEKYFLMLEEGSVITNIDSFYSGKCKKIIFVGEKNTDDVSQLKIIKPNKNIIINKIKDISNHSIVTAIGKENFLKLIMNYIKPLIYNKDFKNIDTNNQENISYKINTDTISTSLMLNSNFKNFLISRGDIQAAKLCINRILLDNPNWAQGYKDLAIISINEKK